MPHSFVSEEDFSAAYDEYADAIFRHCYLRVFEREKAKDLMAHTFMRLWQFIADGNDVDSMQLMLYRLSHRLIEEERARDPLGLAGGADDEEEQMDLQPSELRVLRQVPPEDRCVLVLHFVDGFTLQEIGAILGGAIQDHALALRKGSSLLSSLLSSPPRP